MKAVIVCGDRHGRFSDWLPLMRRELNAFRDGEHCLVLHGDQHGVDKIASYLCRSDPDHFAESRFPISKHLWREIGRGMGPVRNENMAGVLLAYRLFGFDVKVLGFHSNYAEKSRGTRNMLTIAKKVGLPYELFESTHVTRQLAQLELAGIGARSVALANSGITGGDSGPTF